MSKEALYSIDKRCIFRETFNSEQDTRRNGGVPTDVEFSNGIATFNGSSSYIKISSQGIGSELSVRTKVKIKSAKLTPIFSGGIIGASSSLDGFYFVLDARTSYQRPYFAAKGNPFYGSLYCMGDVVDKWIEFIVSISKSNNTVSYYLDGELINEIAYDTELDLLQTEILSIAAQIYYNAFYGDCEMNLLEIYDEALSAEEVYNMNRGMTYKDVTNGMILNVDAFDGVIQDRMGNEVLNTGEDILLKKDPITSMYFPGTISCYLTVSKTISTTCSVSCWVKKMSGIVSYIVDFRDTNGWVYIDLTGLINTNAMTGEKYVNGVVEDTIELNKWQFITVTGIPIDSVLTIIGARYSLSSHFLTGNINQLRVYEGTLSSYKVSQIYTSNKHKYE